MNAPPTRAAPTLRAALLLAACIVVAWLAALRSRQDANWDLQNYHFYDPWAWLGGRIFDWDIAAAQLQTFHNPLPDVPFYALVAAGVDPRTITAWLALPTGVAAYFAIRIAWRLFGDLAAVERAGATVAAVAIGFTGAMGIAQLGSTTDEWLVTAFAMAALWLLLPIVSLTSVATADARHAVAAPLAAGALMGIASGLKLTAATYAVGLCAALVTRRVQTANNLRAIAWYAAGGIAGLAAAHGAWSYALWKHFGHPLFPYANGFFRSPWWDLHRVLPRRFGAHSAGDWLMLPFAMLAPRPGFVSELAYVDARLPMLYALTIVALGGLVIARLSGSAASARAQFATTSPQWRFIAVFAGASFVVWAIVHSIARYTIPLEIVSGMLIVGLLGWLLRPAHAVVAITLSVALLISTTRPADWGRTDFGPQWFDVRVPPIEPGALVLLVVDAPIAYVLPFFPADARHVGIRNNVNAPGRHNRLAEHVAQVVRDHRGPLYALSFPPGQGEADLAAHRLRRVPGACADVRTNMPTSPIELCRLTRIEAPAR
ncbi:MAG TPA: hypothetical protein VJV77_08920 [Casimicrobiaceae bacterium]|nr:hypothetical protein [Casimicrobiaceae bacterium]